MGLTDGSNGGLTAADVAAVTGNNNGFGGWGDGSFWIIVLFSPKEKENFFTMAKNIIIHDNYKPFCINLSSPFISHDGGETTRTAYPDLHRKKQEKIRKKRNNKK